MRSIPKRQAATLQIRTVTANTIGEHVEAWQDVQTLRGILDMSSGSANYTSFNAKTMESTHIFLCDYTPIEYSATESRLIINGGVYDIAMLDDPCGLHDHWEIYLTYKGVA